MPCKGTGYSKLDGLQAELLDVIASYLSPEDLVSFGSVCRQTVHLLCDQRLWKSNINMILSCDNCLHRLRPMLCPEAMVSPTNRTFRRLADAVQSELNSPNLISVPDKVLALFRAGWCRPVARWIRSPGGGRAFNEGSGLQLADARLPPMEDRMRENVFMFACRTFHWDFVLELLQQDPLLAGFSNPQGETALHYACKEAELEVIATLLDVGADPTAAETAYGWTPACRAAIANQLDVIELLVGRGAVMAESFPELMAHAAENGSAEVFNALKAMLPDDEHELALERGLSTADPSGVEFLSRFGELYQRWRPYKIHMLFSAVVERQLLRVISENMSEEAQRLLLGRDDRFNGCCVLIGRQRWDLLSEFLQSSVVSDDEVMGFAFAVYAPHSQTLLELAQRIGCKCEVAQAVVNELERRGLYDCEERQQLLSILRTRRDPPEERLRARLREAVKQYQAAATVSYGGDSSDESFPSEEYEEEEEEEPWE